VNSSSSLSDKLQVFLTGRIPGTDIATRFLHLVSSTRIAGVALPSGRFATLDHDALHASTTMLIGLPFGAVPTSLKLSDLQPCVRAHMRSIGIVVDPGLLEDSASCASVAEEIVSVTSQVSGWGGSVGLATELAHVDWEGRERLCRIAEQHKMAFLASSAGAIPSEPLDVSDVRRLRKMLPTPTKLWAVGCVIDCPAAQELLAHGADQVGIVPSMDGMETKKWLETLSA